jgi:hypothetical protein
MTGDFRCVVHGGVTDAEQRVLVGVEEQCSGPGIPIFACQPCVDGRGITPALGPGEHPPPGLHAPAGGLRRAP